MRNGQNPRKNRGRNNNTMRRGTGNPSANNYNYPRPQTVFESNGPEGKIRGNAQQIYEKYIALATDAAVSDDKVLSESFFQHAEHYLRIVLHDTDIEYETYRREQQMRRDGILNFVDNIDDDFDDMDAPYSNDDNVKTEDSSDVVIAENCSENVSDTPKEEFTLSNNSNNNNRPRRFAERRPPAIKAENDINRMMDPPGFLSPSASVQRKEIKIETSAKAEQKTMVMDVESV